MQAAHIAHARSTQTWRSADEAQALGAAGSELTKAYAVLQELASGVHDKQLGAVVGWKCGATNNNAQSSLGVSGPFLAPLFANSVHTIGTGDCMAVEYAGLGAPSFKANSEAEFAFAMKEDLPPRDDGRAYTELEVWAAVAVVSPAIELVASRYDASGAATTTSAKVADCGINAACIIGRGVMAPNFGDPANLVNVRAGLLIDGAEVCFATGAAVLGNPLTSLTWLANDLPKLLAGQHLKAGDVVMSGAICASTAFDVGSTLEVCFAGLRKDRDCTVQAKFI